MYSFRSGPGSAGGAGTLRSWGSLRHGSAIYNNVLAWLGLLEIW